MNALEGRLIVFEGGEGTGKTTQIRLLAERLRNAGCSVVAVREPGGTVVGEGVRAVLLDRANTGLDPRAELLLYEASRAEHVASVIAPRLAAGDWVLCDRFTDSSLAYQGYGRGLDIGSIRDIDAFATAGVTAALTILIDMDPTVGLERATGGGADRLEAEELAFHERVRAGYLELARAPAHAVIDGSGTLEEVGDAVWRAVLALDPALDAPQGGR
jgi:dTMP kinase